jgi:serine phosphatase RsbU (regulator of sigma subunit)
MKRLFFIILLLFANVLVHAQNVDVADSLKALLANTSSDTIKASLYLDIATNSYHEDSVEKYALLALPIAERYSKKRMEMICYDNIGWAKYYKMNFNSALDAYIKCNEISKEIGDAHFEAVSYVSLGNVYLELADNANMWDCYYKSLKLFTELCDTSNICYVNRNIGQTFCDLGMYKSAYENFFNSLNLNQIAGDTTQMSLDYRLIGETMLKQHRNSTGSEACMKLQTAKKYMKMAEMMMPTEDNEYIMAERSGNYINLADSYILLAQLMHRRDYIDSSRYYLSLFKDRELGHNEAFMLAAQTEASLLMYENKYTEAVAILDKALKKAVADSSLRNEMTINEKLYECYANLGNSSKALSSITRYYTLKQGFANEDEMKRSAEFQAKVEIQNEKKQQEIFREVHQHQQDVLIISFSIGFVLMLIIVFLVLKALFEKRKANTMLVEKNNMLQFQKEEIARQRDMLTKQNEIVRRSNNQMRNSITYAQRIQRSVVSSQEEISEVFPDSFVLYRAKDIVSGDFYRVDEILGQKIVVVADCTGHGVPGALLSMMGISVLKDILAQAEVDCRIINPDDILEQMRDFVKKALNKGPTDESYVTGDGMDMSVCVFPADGPIMKFAGANQSALLIHNGVPKRLKGDFMPIGNFVRESRFKSQTVEISKGDSLFLFSDGIQDQIGGVDGSKYTLKRLIDKLCDVCTLDIEKQEFEMEKDIELWMGDYVQLDDITLLGIRIQ